ncbi:hypothetical protein INT45_006504 [Circinella minor]|uniref:Uncharacterized protein n=1 Tax=Circinella minor TaxID=1195481 RepID=A0A8H7VFC8_9FUNG|nr:hypothetical protein INT45_006504 [Circinella minor]
MKFTTISTFVVAMVALTQTIEAQSTCPAQTVLFVLILLEFNKLPLLPLLLSIYKKKRLPTNINHLILLDYACLCKWQTAKVSCWDTCPDDVQRGTEAALMTTYCSQPGANVTVVPSSSSVLPSSSQASISQASNTASPSNDDKSAASSLGENNIFYITSSMAAIVAGYMLQ